MIKENKNTYEYIKEFNPDVMPLEQAHQDFSSILEKFSAGIGYENFDSFIKEDAMVYRDAGDGVTYVVWNVFFDENACEINREVTAFYTLAATAIPYEDRIRLDIEEAEETGQEFDTEICGISALEIKMFAVDKKYQDVFYKYEGENLPVSAWIMRNIIDFANTLLQNVIGFKALFLHSLPEAENFYKENGFNPMEINMQPLHCLDSEYKAMYLALKEVHMNYDN